MSEATNLLNSLTEDDIAAYTADPTTEPHIIVDENRIVAVPEVLKRIAVQNDNEIETVTFDCPRYWDDHDMSKMIVYINYLPPDGVVGSYVATNVAVDDNDPNIMHFDWTITRNVTINEGRMIFLVDIKGANGEHWHSELCEDMYISKGIEPPPIIDIGDPDILTQVLMFKASVDQLNTTTLQRAAVHVGSGDMPAGYNVQVIPDGTNGDGDYVQTPIGITAEVKNNVLIIKQTSDGSISVSGNGVYLRVRDNEGNVTDIPYIRGFSAYQVAVANGFEGTEKEWLSGIMGVPGLSAYEVAKENGFEGSESEWLVSLIGPKGDIGVTPKFKVGTVTTLEAGKEVTVTVTGTAENPVLNFAIPTGLPVITADMEGQLMRVVNGKWAASTVQNAEEVSY